MATYNETMNGGLNVSGTVPWNYTAGHTDRNVTGGDGFTYAKCWSMCETREELLGHQAAAEFKSVVERATMLQGDQIVLVRVRGVSQVPPSPMDMGPPPPGFCPPGLRYNRDGECVLYLASSEEGLRREYENWRASGTPYVQTYHLPINTLRIADFVRSPPDHFLTAVFSIAEECGVPGRGSKNYLFSQTVAELVSSQFDGMCVPGVRGSRDAYYTNVVVFRPHPHWRGWIAPGALPYPLPTGLSDEKVATAAYFLWEKAGRPHGRDAAHWYLAIDELMRAAPTAL